MPIASLPAIPEILKNPQLLQLVFAKLQQETDRANLEAGARQDAIAQREEWKKIADRDAARADELEKADKARINESTDLRASVGFLRTSVDEYKAQHAEDTRTINGLRSQRKWIAFGGGALGAAAGFGICKAGVR